MSLCTLEPFTQNLPVNCNLVVYQLASETSAPNVVIRRGGQDVAATATLVSSTPVTVDVSHSRVCDGTNVTEVIPTDYNVLELALTGAEPGDEVVIAGYGWGSGAGTIDAATSQACPRPYAPECNASELVDCPGSGGSDAGGGGGCQASGGASSLAMAVLAGLVVGRQVRRSRARR